MDSNCRIISTINSATVSYSDGSEVGGATVFADITATQSDSPQILSINHIDGNSQILKFEFSSDTAINGFYIESISANDLTATVLDSTGSQVGSSEQIGDVMFIRCNLYSSEFIVTISGSTSDYTMSKPVILGYDITENIDISYNNGDQSSPWSGVSFAETQTAKYAHKLNNKFTRSLDFTEIKHDDYDLLIDFLTHFDARPLLFVGLEQDRAPQFIFGIAEKGMVSRQMVTSGSMNIKIIAMHNRIFKQKENKWLL